MKHFRIQVSITGSDFSDTFYFRGFPSQDLLLRAMDKNKKIADSAYEDNYKTIIRAVELMREDYPTYWPTRLAMTATHIQFGCHIQFQAFSFFEEETFFEEENA